MNAVIEIADEPAPLDEGGGYPWIVSFGAGRDVTGRAETRELAAKAVGLAIHDEQVSRSVHAWYDARAKIGKDCGD